MSLINEALKKAQERQNASRSSNMPAFDENQTKSPNKPENKNQWILIIIFAFVALVIVSTATGLIVYGLTQGKSQEVAQSPTPKNEVPQPSSIEALEKADIPVSSLERIAFNAPKEIQQSTNESDELTAGAEETITANQPAQNPTVRESTIQTIPQEPEQVSLTENTSTSISLKEIQNKEENTPKPTVLQQPAEPVVAVVPTADPEIDIYINNLKVRGIMSGGSKVLIFDPSLGSSNAYENKSKLLGPYNLTISQIQPRQIIFVDHAGFSYTKRF